MRKLRRLKGYPNVIESVVELRSELYWSIKAAALNKQLPLLVAETQGEVCLPVTWNWMVAGSLPRGDLGT